MSVDELQVELERLHAPEHAAPELRADHQRALLERFDALHTNVPSPRRGWAKLGVAGLGLGLLVGACALPADLELGLGVGLHMQYAGVEELPVHAIAEFCKDELGANDITVEVSIQRSVDDEGVEQTVGSLDLELWGTGLSGDDVVPALQAEFAVLAPITIDIEALEGNVRTNMGGKFMHRFLDVEAFVDDEDVEKARAEVLLELRARGISGAVDVEVSVESIGEHRALRIGVRQEAVSAETGDAGDAQADLDELKLRLDAP